MNHTFLSIILFFICISGYSQYHSQIKIERLLQTDTTTIGQKIIYPQNHDNEVTILKITIPPGQSTGWHKHIIPVFAFVLEGKLTVEFENGKKADFPANSTFSEVIDTYHNGKNTGTQDLILIAFYLGKKGNSLSVKRDSM